MEYDLFGGSYYEDGAYDEYELFGGAQSGGGSKRYQSGWKTGIPKKPGYKLVKVNGQPKYIKKKARYLLGYNVFVSEYRRKHKSVQGPNLMKKAGAAWRKLSAAEQAKYKTKAHAKGKMPYEGPVSRPVAKAHMAKLGKRKRVSKRRSVSKSRSRRSKRRSVSKSRRRRSVSKSRSRRRSASKSRSRQRGRGCGGEHDTPLALQLYGGAYLDESEHGYYF